MPENQNPNTNPNNDPSVKPYQQVEFNPNDTEFAQENPNFNNPLATNNLQAEQKSKEDDHETKDARGGNHNPNGASGYTSGRVDDRGRKSDKDEMEKKSADPRAKDEARTHPNSGVGYTDDERTGGND